jgi:hypothetical protein
MDWRRTGVIVVFTETTRRPALDFKTAARSGLAIAAKGQPAPRMTNVPSPSTRVSGPSCPSSVHRRHLDARATKMCLAIVTCDLATVIRFG